MILFHHFLVLFLKKPSSTSIQAIETTHTLEISRKNLHELYEKYIEIERLGRLITEKYFIASELYYHEFHHLSALERFENLIKQKPYLTQRVPLSMIASYIGISNSTLSRLRAKRLY